MEAASVPQAEASAPLITPIKCALKYVPPVLILVYKEGISGKVRRRSMPLRGFSSNTDIQSYIEDLKLNRNKPYFDAISKTQLTSLLKRVQTSQAPKTVEKKPYQASTHSSLKDLPLLSSVAETQNIQVQDGIKSQPDEGSNLLINSASLDKKFSQELNALLNDDGIGEDSKFGSLAGRIDIPHDYGNRHFGGDSIHLVPDYSPDFISESEKISVVIIPALIFSKNWKVEGEDSISIGPLDLGPLNLGTLKSSQEDLNQVSEEELIRRKAEMEEVFEANRLKPGDEGYEYDIEKEFGGGKIESGWDSDESSNMEF